MAADEKSANQFISALVKNLQAVCHGHVEFDQNVKVVGHLYLTVDSNTEFNYILNEKVSKSDESSTTFVSKSFYASDPQQKTPKKNPERPFPSPTPNVLGKTRFDISVDLTDEPLQGGQGRYQQMAQQRGQFSHPRGGFSMQRTPQMRRRPFDQRGPQMAKMPRLSSPMRHPMNLAPGAPRRMPTPLPQRLPGPSSVTSPSISSESKTDITPPSSIPPESVSATPAQSLPGADKPETEAGKDGEKNAADSEKDVKFEVIKVENGNVVASDKDKGEAELRIESVTSHDLSLPESESTGEKEGESKNSETSDSDKPSSDPPPPDTAPSEPPETSSAASSSKSPKQNDPEVIEIDLTKVKDEIDSLFEGDSNVYDSSSQQRHSSGSFSGAQGGDNSLSSFGGESNDDEFFASLREQTVGLYPVGLHANESNNAGQNFHSGQIPSLPGGVQPEGAYMPVAGTSAGSSQNNQQVTKKPSHRSYSLAEKFHITSEVRKGKGQTAVAREYGIPESTLRGWLKYIHISSGSAALEPLSLCKPDRKDTNFLTNSLKSLRKDFNKNSVPEGLGVPETTLAAWVRELSDISVQVNESEHDVGSDQVGKVIAEWEVDQDVSSEEFDELQSVNIDQAKVQSFSYRSRAHYSSNKREKLVNRVLKGEKKADLCREFDIPESTLRAWMRRSTSSDPPTSNCHKLFTESENNNTSFDSRSELRRGTRRKTPKVILDM